MSTWPCRLKGRAANIPTQGLLTFFPRAPFPCPQNLGSWENLESPRPGSAKDHQHGSLTSHLPGVVGEMPFSNNKWRGGPGIPVVAEFPSILQTATPPALPGS